MARHWLIVAFAFGLSGCAGELTVLAALAFGMTLGSWIIGRDRQRRALYEADTLRHAIANGEHRALEERLRKTLALAAAGEAVAPERHWLARAQLGGLLVAEWRLEEAAGVYAAADQENLSPHVRALAAFGRHELAVLETQPDQARVDAIRRDRDDCMQHVPKAFHQDVTAAWDAVEGLCLVRMGRAREAIPLLEGGLKALEYNPALVVYQFHLGQAYQHIGERQLASVQYELAAASFPGTRLASEASSRLKALGPGSGEGMFRRILPEAPATTGGAMRALGPGEPDDDD